MTTWEICKKKYILTVLTIHTLKMVPLWDEACVNPYCANHFSMYTLSHSVLIIIHGVHLNKFTLRLNKFTSVQSLIRVWLFAIPCIAAHQASLSITISQTSLRLTSIESVMPSSHPILGRPLLLLPPFPPSIRVFSNESTLHMRWPKYWSFSSSIIPSKEIPGLISFRMDWLDLLAVQGTLKSLLQHQVQKHQFFGAQPSSQSNSHIHTWPQEKR